MENINNDVTNDERFKILNEMEPMSFFALAFTLMTLTEEERNRLDEKINEWKKKQS